MTRVSATKLNPTLRWGGRIMRIKGIDVSKHQGEIDWAKVA